MSKKSGALVNSLFTGLVMGLGACLLAACGGGGGGGSGNNLASGYPSSPKSCDVPTQRAWLRDLMNDQYLWYNQQGVANEAASSMISYFESLLNKDKDSRYSSAQSTASFNQFFSEGKRTNYGYSLILRGSDTLIVQYTEPLSPAGQGGLKRGDTIVSINGFSPSQIINGALTAVSTAGVARTIVATNPTDGTRSLNLVSAEYSLSPVLSTQIFTASNGRKVGYIVYNSFIGASSTPLATSIDQLRSAGIQEVIFDMRYNGGGSTLVAQNVAYLLGGANLAGNVLTQYKFNNKNSAYNFVDRFPSSSYTTALSGMSRIFVISGAGTASASEIIINGLKPYRSVITIGDTTYGKPYASQPTSACDITYNPIIIELANASGFGDYAAGIPATCNVSDDLSRALGDPLEARTAAALNYISTGACPTASTGFSQKNMASAGKKSTQFATKNVASDSSLTEEAQPQQPSPAVLDGYGAR